MCTFLSQAYLIEVTSREAFLDDNYPKRRQRQQRKLWLHCQTSTKPVDRMEIEKCWLDIDFIDLTYTNIYESQNMKKIVVYNQLLDREFIYFVFINDSMLQGERIF